MKPINFCRAGVVCGLLLGGAAQAADIPKLALHAAQEYRQRADFPEWSFPLVNAADPILSGREASRQRMSGPNGAAPALETWVDRVAYFPGETVDLFARLDWSGMDSTSALESLRSDSLSGWRVTGELILDTVGQLANVEYADDGRGADALAGDGIYSARVLLDEDLAPALGRAQSVMIQLNAENAAGDVRKAVGGFQYSNPGAYLTGEFRRVVEDGNLKVLAEVDVLSSGRYHLAGTLNDALGQPAATAQNAQQLETGKQWLDLSFYGLIFHQLADTSGLKLASTTLTSASRMPNALGPVLQADFAIGTLKLAELTEQSFADPNMLDTVKRLEASVITETLSATKPLLSQ